MANIEYKCGICENGELSTHTEFNRSQIGNIPFEYSKCDTCGSEQANASQASANKRAMLAITH
jgi:hypothetical protein